MSDVVFVPIGFPQRQLWRDLLRHWCLLLKRYESDGEDDPDFDYWYGEQPLTGLLGSAASMLPEGWGQEEPDGPGRGVVRLGRGETRVTVATKIYWVAERMPIANEQVQKKLDEAAALLQGLPPSHHQAAPVSVCYVVPEYDGPDAMDAGLKALTALERWARSKSMATAKHLANSSPDTACQYAGVLLVARLQPWAK